MIVQENKNTEEISFTGVLTYGTDAGFIKPK